MQDREQDIQDRTFQFAVRVINLVRSMPNDIAGQVLGRQLARSGTSVGSNVEEAQAAESRRDFAHKLGIARKEARESRYWLRLIAASELLPAARMREISRESEAIVRILTAIVKRLQTEIPSPRVIESRAPNPELRTQNSELARGTHG
jgi:four helix bundle protein